LSIPLPRIPSHSGRGIFAFCGIFKKEISFLRISLPPHRIYPKEEIEMKMLLLSLVVLLLIGGPALAQDLKRISLDDASAMGLQIQCDSAVKAEGKASIKITTKWPTTVCLAEVNGPEVEDAKLIYKAKVKSDLQGTAFLEMWAHVGGGQYFSKGMNDPIQGKSDWKTIQTPFMFQKGQKPAKVTLNIVINGTGTVWVDDIVLSKGPLK